MRPYLAADNLRRGSSLGRVALGLLRSAWAAIRLQMLTLLTILEPIVAFVLSALALLGVLTTIFFKLVGPPSFPALKMLVISLGFGMALAVYRYVIAVLSR